MRINETVFKLKTAVNVVVEKMKNAYQIIALGTSAM